MHRRVEGLDPAVERLGEPGDTRDMGDLVAGVPDGLGCRSCRHHVEAGLGERAGQVDEAGLVADRDEGACDGHDVTVAVQALVVCWAGYWVLLGMPGEWGRPVALEGSKIETVGDDENRLHEQATAFGRVGSGVQFQLVVALQDRTSRKGTRSCTMTGPWSTLSSTTMIGTSCCVDSGGKGVADPVYIREFGEVGGVGVDEVRWECVNDGPRQKSHEAAQDEIGFHTRITLA